MNKGTLILSEIGLNEVTIKNESDYDPFYIRRIRKAGCSALSIVYPIFFLLGLLCVILYKRYTYGVDVYKEIPLFISFSAGLFIFLGNVMFYRCCKDTCSLSHKGFVVKIVGYFLFILSQSLYAMLNIFEYRINSAYSGFENTDFVFFFLNLLLILISILSHLSINSGINRNINCGKPFLTLGIFGFIYTISAIVIVVVDSLNYYELIKLNDIISKTINTSLYEKIFLIFTAIGFFLMSLWAIKFRKIIKKGS